MLCDVCRENQATIRLIAVVDGQKTERHLCTACVAKQKLQLKTEGISSVLSAFMAGVEKKPQKHPDLRCGGCGLRYDDMMQAGKMGCAMCYQDFREHLRPLLLQMHEAARHVGRVPKYADAPMQAYSRIEQIRREMDMAVVLEDFELAATLRDELRALECQGGGRNG